MERNNEWLPKLREYFFSPRLVDLKVNEAIEFKYNFIPKRLFKYRQFGDYAINNLIDDTFWCQSANGFNDPFDTSIKFKYEQNALNNLLLESLKEANENDEGSLCTPDELDVLSNSDNPEMLLAKIVSNKMEADFSAESLYDFMRKTTEDFTEKMNFEFNRNLKMGYKVCSLSEKNDSLLMWSHYADEHKGFVMEYNFSEYPCDDLWTRFLWPIIYDDNLFDASKFFNESIVGGMPNNMLGIIASIHKAEDWSYEKEWRFILPKGPDEPSLNYPCPPVKAIYLGALATKETENELIKIAKEKGISVYKMELSGSSFNMLPKLIHES